MKILNATLNTRKGLRLTMLAVVLCIIGTTLVVYAQPQTVTITIANNSAGEIRHLYLSPAGTDNWGPDQLNNSSIGPGASRTLNITWDQPTVKLVGEDQEGCFLTVTVDATSGIQWTITNDTPRNCGG